MDRKTQFIFRLKCIIKKCRENGLFNIAIKLKENSTLTLEDIKTTIYNNIDMISKNSSKRAGGWFNLSGTIIKKLHIS